MSEDGVLVRIVNLGKSYKVFPSTLDNALDALGLAWLVPWRRVAPREYWALRGVDLELRRGQRIGVIGRNGAGKTTLLKVLTGNLGASEGTVEVSGHVHALMDAGAGFHPEFTGRENIRAALTFQGMTPTEIAAAEEEIVEFTELAEFIEQPLKTYSLGMWARLAFATATAIRPEILVVDEILAAGDAYFLGRSAERIRALTEGGVSMLVVSHSMGQITQLCTEAIWLERGQVVLRGPSLEVVKSYERFVRELEDRRLRAKNFKKLAGVKNPALLEGYAHTFVVRLTANGGSPGGIEVSRLALWRGAECLERVAVGMPQDASPDQPSRVVLSGGEWSDPVRAEEGRCCRRLEALPGQPASGSIVFALEAWQPDVECSVEVEYRSGPTGSFQAECWFEGKRIDEHRLEASPAGWRCEKWPVRGERGTPPTPCGNPAAAAASGLCHWPGEGSLQVTSLALEDGEGRPCAVFAVGSHLKLRVRIEARREGLFPLQPVAVFYRPDGVNVTTLVSDPRSVSMRAGAMGDSTLSLDPLNLGNGRYVISVALYKEFDPELRTPPAAYDWVDRSLEFLVVGTPPAITSTFMHPCRWTHSP